MEYLEVEKLKAQYKKYAIKISQAFDHIREDLFFVTLTIGSKSWDILIDDEFAYYSKYNPILDWFLVLYALDAYKECEDIIAWSREYDITVSTSLEYYKSLSEIYSEIESVIGPIDPLISSYDYSLRTGIFRALIEVNP